MIGELFEKVFDSILLHGGDDLLYVSDCERCWVAFMNDFRVYNGPMILLESKRYGQKLAYPRCRDPECVRRICEWMSTEYCFDHAIEYVKEWDKQNATND